MKITQEKINETLYKFIAESDKQEFDQIFNNIVQQYKNQMNFDGFRKGKVPNSLVIQRAGKDNLISDSIDELLQNEFNIYLNDNNIVTYKNPEINIVNNPKDNKSPYLLAELTQTTFPKITMPKEKDYSLSVDDLETIKSNEYNKRILALQKQFATLKSVSREAKKGDFLTIDMVAKSGKDILEEDKKKQVELDKDIMQLPGLFDALKGAKKDDIVKFDSKLLTGEHKDKDVKIEVKVSAIKEQKLPKLDDDFAMQASEFDTYQKLEEEFKKEIESQAIYIQIGDAREKLLIELDKLKFDVPEAMLQDYEQQTKMDIFQRGPKDDPTKVLEMLENMKDDIEKAAKADAKREILFTTYAKINKIQPSQDQIFNYIYNSAMQTGYDIQKYMDLIKENDSMPMIVNSLTQSLAIDEFMKKADIKDSKGKAIDLNPKVNEN